MKRAGKRAAAGAAAFALMLSTASIAAGAQGTENIKGDVDGNGSVNAADLAALCSVLFGRTDLSSDEEAESILLLS